MIRLMFGEVELTLPLLYLHNEECCCLPWTESGWVVSTTQIISRTFPAAFCLVSGNRTNLFVTRNPNLIVHDLLITQEAGALENA